MENAKYAITKADEQELLYKITDSQGWSKYMSQEAALKISEITIEYEELILSQVIILTRNNEHILASDIIAAKEMIDKRKREEWKHKAAYITGAPLVTIFFQGIVSQLFFSSVINPLFVAIYVALGVIGLVLLTWGLLTETR